MEASQKNTSLLIRKSYSLFLGVTLKMGAADHSNDDDEWEPVEPITSPCDSVFGFSGKKLVKQATRCLYLRGGGEGSVLTQHQSRDTEMDGQHETCNESSGRPSTLQQISYFTATLQYTIFYNIILGLGKTPKSQDRFPVMQYKNSLQFASWCPCRPTGHDFSISKRVIPERVKLNSLHPTLQVRMVTTPEKRLLEGTWGVRDISSYRGVQIKHSASKDMVDHAGMRGGEGQRDQW
jgi:hypothetical protein